VKSSCRIAYCSGFGSGRTRTAVAAKVIPLGASALSERVAAFRRGLDVEALRQSAQGGKPVLFDLGLANELYAALIGPVEEATKDASHLLVVPSGPLTSLPFHLLVTESQPLQFRNSRTSPPIGTPPGSSSGKQ
jgi:hypothetical protein